MGDRTDERLKLANALCQGLARGEFVLHYQPFFALASGRIIGVEALIRWQHPELSLLSPACCIPLPEETGDDYAYRPLGAAHCLQTRQDLAGGRPRVSARSGQLSARQLRQLGFSQQIAPILKETGLKAEALELVSPIDHSPFDAASTTGENQESPPDKPILCRLYAGASGCTILMDEAFRLEEKLHHADVDS
jgi:predicted signal transduction protein with EAL and GGDEF domain